jgi:hypothetical protein
MKRMTLIGLMVLLAGVLVACGGGSGIRCVEDMTADVDCLGLIGSLDGSQTLTASSDRFATGMWEVSVQIALDSGSVLVSFTDADGNTVSQEISEAGVARGTAGIVDGRFDVTMESVEGAASGISYTISLNEVES